jgi:formylglycine-generating enzyme required for sulfatase activity
MSFDQQIQHIRRTLAIDPNNPGLRRRYDNALLRVYGRGCLDTLQSIKLWQSSETVTQDAASAHVFQELGFGWEKLETRVYQCNKQSVRIAAFLHTKTDIRFHLIPGGTFDLGSSQVIEARPTQKVTIQPLLVSRYPVLQSQWDKIGGSDRRKWSGPSLPIEGVAWKAIKDWLEKAGDRLRLPSESEWEYACRAGSNARYFWGSSMSADYCWHKQNSKSRTHAPSKHEAWPNAFGLVDMLGNVFEACEDRYYPDYHGNFPVDGRPRGDHRGTERVRRGGSWCGYPEDCQAAYRKPYPRWKQISTLGFRIARSVPSLEASWEQS